jgi:hypothetical protein
MIISAEAESGACCAGITLENTEESRMKKTTVKPRNRLVAAARFRKAGAHGKSNKAIRRLKAMETLLIKREVE